MFRIESKLFLYSGKTANWHFLTVSKADSEKVKEKTKGLRKGFGSVPVTVTIGRTSWETSIFPDSKSGTFLLPVKASVRKAEDLYADDMVNFSFTLKKH